MKPVFIRVTGVLWISRLDKKYGHIDALVNNAYPRNKQYGRPFFDVEYKDFVENIGLNLSLKVLNRNSFNFFKL